MHYLEKLKYLNILFADDDPIFHSSTCRILNMLFKNVYSVKDGLSALEIFETNLIHIVMLDVKLGDISGVEVAKKIRLSGSQVPIFLISSYTETNDLIEACRLNLIDYMVKPFTFETLTKTLGSCIQTLSKEMSLLIPITSTISYNSSQRVLVEKEVNIALTKSERIVLELLLESKGRIVFYERFYSLFGEDVSCASWKNIILRLRKKLGKDSIRNISNVGYTLI